MVLQSKKINIKRLIWSAIIGLLFALSFVWGYQLQNKGTTARSLSQILIGLLVSIGIGAVFCAVFYFLLFLVEKIKPVEITKMTKKKSFFIFIICWAVTFLAWIPVFLAYYPCVMSSDFDIQLYQVKQGHEFFTNHHPYLSTLEIEFFYKLSPILGTVRKAMAALGIWHLLVLSSAFAMLALTIYKLTGRKWLLILSSFLFILYPVNPVLGLSTTKDVVFSAAFVWLMCLLIERFFITEGKKTFRIIDLPIFFFGFIMCSFRNNAIYAILVSALILVWLIPKREKLWLCVMSLAVISSFKLSQAGIEKALGVSSSAATPEMHSIIIQTLGRTYNDIGDDLPLEIKETIEFYIPKEALPLYNPALSDPLKTPVTLKTFGPRWKGHMGQLFSDWIKIGLKYPGEYLDAVLDLTRGYWYLCDRSYAEVWGSGLEFRMGLLYTNNTSGFYGMDEIWHESKLPGLELVYEKILSRNDFFKWPILNIFFRLSFYTLGMMFVGVLFIYKKEWKKAAFILLPILYFGTLLLGPTAYIRYVFPIMMMLPLFVSLIFVNTNGVADNGL